MTRALVVHCHPLEESFAAAVRDLPHDLILTGVQGERIMVPAGTGEGDWLVLGDGDRLIALQVRVHESA